MVNYQNGKIYQLVCNDTGLVYIGSTTQSLAKRKGQHVHDYKKYKRGDKCSKLSAFAVLEHGNFDIYLIENCACNSKEELLKREGEWIRKTDCVNRRIEGRTPREYYQDNRELVLAKQKDYYQDNRELVLAKQKDYYQENRQRIQDYYQENRQRIQDYHQDYYQENRQRIRDKQKDYYQENRERINQKFTCSCGSVINKRCKWSHLKSKKHQTFEKQMSESNTQQQGEKNEKRDF